MDISDIRLRLSKGIEGEDLANFGLEGVGDFEGKREGGVVLASLEIADCLIVHPNSVGELLAREPLGAP
jgi:hypothetical protein